VNSSLAAWYSSSSKHFSPTSRMSATFVIPRKSSIAVVASAIAIDGVPVVVVVVEVEMATTNGEEMINHSSRDLLRVGLNDL
jgi:hypothetical protein